MPSSMHYNHRFIIDHIINSKPMSVLDIGCGYGKWGFLTREYREAHEDRCYPEQWEVRVEGVEIWERYVMKLPWLKDLYDHIFINDITRVVKSLKPYDIIIAGDVIEHISKHVAKMVMRELIARAKKIFILSIPLGEGWLGNAIVDGNQYENHLSTWTEREVLGFRADCESVHVQIDDMHSRGPIGAFAFIKKGAMTPKAMKWLRHSLEHRPVLRFL